MATVLTIDGVVVTMLVGWSISLTANGRSTFRCQILSVDGSYRPHIKDELTVVHNAIPIFGGFITSAPEAGPLGEYGVSILTTVGAGNYNALATRRFLSGVIPTGNLKAAATAIVPYIPGATLDPAQVNGPTLPELVYADAKVEGILNDLTTQSGGFLWRIDNTKQLRFRDPSTVPAPFNILANSPYVVGDLTSEPTQSGYANRVIIRSGLLRAIAEDAGELAAEGPWEAFYLAPENTPQASLDLLASSILARSLPTQKTVKYQTRTPGLEPGQAQTITVPKRNVNNIFLITEVVITGGEEGLLFTVTAIEGMVYQTGWREIYKQWAGGGGVAVAGGGGGGTAFQRLAYFLGGNGVDATQSPTPTWVPASAGGVIGQGAIQVQINTVPRGTLSATITARLRVLDSGNSVRARLYDVTDSVACAGLSSVVTTTTWTTVSWAVTLTAGSHLYELQLLPGVANLDVQATAYLE